MEHKEYECCSGCQDSTSKDGEPYCEDAKKLMKYLVKCPFWGVNIIGKRTKTAPVEEFSSSLSDSSREQPKQRGFL